jgi:hypothetical protein
MKKKVVAVCQDPGAACAIAPVIVSMRESDKYDLLVVGYKYSREVYKSRGIEYSTFCELGVGGIGNKQLSGFLEKQKPDLLLLGTSLFGDFLEKQLTILAREKEIRTLAVLDYWSNYWQRFSDPDGENKLKYVPDFIAIMDDFAKKEMINEGFDADKLVVTGQPYFDDIKDECGKFTELDRNNFLENLGVDAGGTFIVFASQPIEKYRGGNPEREDFLGFTEKTSRDALIDALNDIKNKSGAKFSLFIKLHPKEDLGGYNISKKCDFPVFVNQDADPRRLIFSADIVTGITSVFMIEAMFAGRPVISIQPNLSKRDFLFTNHLGLTRGVYRPEDLEPALTGAMSEKGPGKESNDRQDKYLHHANATGNLLKLIGGITEI